MAVKYLAGDRLIGTAAERAALSASEFDMSDWKQIAKTTKDEKSGYQKNDESNFGI